MTKSQGTVRIGTAGWTYPHWKGTFYPHDLADDERLLYYTRHFDSVEINNSFYQLPTARTLRHWRDIAPTEFRFAVKASRYITHMKKLKDPEDGLTAFLDRVAVLEHKIGPILFQMPPRWRFNEERLAAFLKALSGDFRYAFEFRDHSWINERTYGLLSAHGAAFCIYELNGFLSPKEITADFIYVRLHGPEGPYQGSYDARVLSGWAGSISAWARAGRDIYCYFDNDQAGYAPENAGRLRQMLAHH